MTPLSLDNTNIKNLNDNMTVIIPEPNGNPHEIAENQELLGHHSRLNTQYVKGQSIVMDVNFNPAAGERQDANYREDEDIEKIIQEIELKESY